MTGTPPGSPARLLAFRVLLALESGFGPERRRAAGTPDSLLARFEADMQVGEADRGLARELVFGALKGKRLLDHTLDCFSRRPVRKLEPALRVLLRIGLHQLRTLTRIPPHAALFETVRIARMRMRPGAARLVNAVLRAYLRADHAGPSPEGDPDLWMRVGLSHPDWMVDRLVRRLGEAGARARMEANNCPPQTFLRVRRDVDLPSVQERLLEDGVPTEVFPMAPRCLLARAGNPLRTAAHREGRVHIQDAGSQLVGWLLPLHDARRALDGCAAPGGKATILAERFHPRRVVAADLRPARMRLLERIASRLQADNLHRVVADAASPPFSPGSFDRILLDVPCSGLGTLARNPDLKWTSSPERVRRLARTEARLASAAVRLLAPGGLLLYATCSLEPEETEDVVAGLLDAAPGLERVSLGAELPPESRRFLDPDGTLRILPESSGTDGYFAALLRRPALS